MSSPPKSAHDIDVAEAAFQSARGKGVLRLHPSRLAVLPESAGIRALIARTADFDPPPTLDELRDLMNEAAKELSDDDSAFRKHLDDFAGNASYASLTPTGAASCSRRESGSRGARPGFCRPSTKVTTIRRAFGHVFAC